VSRRLFVSGYLNTPVVADQISRGLHIVGEGGESER
jgi:hypothetical protein